MIWRRAYHLDSNQMIAWAVQDLSRTFLVSQKKSGYCRPVGRGFGAKLRIRADAVLAALGARAVGRPVKIALTVRR